jgi:hypothetical protein
LENHKSQIVDWDLGAGIYIDYYILKNSMQEESAMDDSVNFFLYKYSISSNYLKMEVTILLSFRIHLRRKMNLAEVSLDD